MWGRPRDPRGLTLSAAARGILLALGLLAASLGAAADATAAAAPRPLLLDCDPGVDDAFAIAWICARPDRFRLVALTAIPGNVMVNTTLRNAVGALELFGCGVGARLGAGTDTGGSSDGFMHEDGLMGLAGGLPAPGPLLRRSVAEARGAADVILEVIDEFGGELDIVAVGPLTNLAAAEEARPGILRSAGGLYIMGGGFKEGNVRPWAEFNFWYHPAAARRVLASVDNATLFPLDATRRLCWEERHTAMLKAAPSPPSAWLLSMHAPWDRTRASYGQRCIHIHDAVPVGYALNASRFVMERVRIEVQDEAPYAGRSVIMAGGVKNAWLVKEVEQSLYDELFEDVIRHFGMLSKGRALRGPTS